MTRSTPHAVGVGDRRIRLGQLLVQQAVVTPDQLAIALAEQRQSGAPLARVLVRLGFCNENAVREVAARAAGRESLDLAQVVADAEALRLVPLEFARRQRILPIAYDAGSHRLTVATTETFDLMVLDQLRALIGGHVEVRALLAVAGSIEDCIDRFYGHELTVDGIVRELETGEIDYESLEAGGDEYTHPMVRLVNSLLVDAVKRGASDVHFEPEFGFVRIRYRIDGVLETVLSLHRAHLPGITVRLKVLSAMNIAETRAPQDGRLTLTVSGRAVDFRVSTQPTIYGENIVLRVLDREKSVIGLEGMALRAGALASLGVMLARPEGILIVTGPTGSGKTTTLYSLLARVSNDSVNIMTMEDPVEYPLPLLRQTSVNEVARMDFADGIRSIMRQDPDIILVGEIRDSETAEMAFRAAMTGHQVFTTLHTGSAIGAFPRLLDIGIRPGIMAGNIVGVIAQRLVRVLCPQCRSRDVPNDEERALIGRNHAELAHVYRPTGCPACGHKGYRGRAPIMELLVMDDDMDELVARGASPRDLRACAIERGYRPLAEEGLQRVAEGLTSLQELARTVDLTGRVR